MKESADISLAPSVRRRSNRGAPQILDSKEGQRGAGDGMMGMPGLWRVRAFVAAASCKFYSGGKPHALHIASRRRGVISNN